MHYLYYFVTLIALPYLILLRFGIDPCINEKWYSNCTDCCSNHDMVDKYAKCLLDICFQKPIELSPYTEYSLKCSENKTGNYSSNYSTNYSTNYSWTDCVYCCRDNNPTRSSTNNCSELCL